MNRKLVVIGAGSAYTPEIIAELIRRQERLQIGRLVLVDIPEGRQRAETILALSKRMLRRAGLNCELSLTLDRRMALRDADFVISQIRVGAWQARAEDEHIGLELGLIGQETTGCGGFMNAMRTIPEALAIAADMEELCPRALLLNFTNPSGVVTEALLRYGKVRTIGLCNVPINMRHDAGMALGVSREEICCRFAGLNHLSFMTSATLAGRDVYPTLLEKLREDPTTMKNIPKVEGTGRLIDALRLIPSPYLQYYYFEPEMLAKEQKELAEQGTTRGEQVEKINCELFRLYENEELDTTPPQLSQRGGSLYSYAAMDILEATLSDTPREMTVNVLNEGAVAGLPDEAGVEATCRVSRGGVERLATQRLPQQVIGLVQMVKRYESLTVDAAVRGSRRLAMQALLCHPLIHGFIRAEEVLRRMEQRQHCPCAWKEM